MPSMGILPKVPPTVRYIYEYQGMSAVAQTQVDPLWNIFDNLAKEFYPALASEVGIERWEEILGIAPSTTSTLEERRFTVLARLAVSIPYTHRHLENLLEIACGPGNYSIEIDYVNYIIKVEIGLTSKHNYDIVVDLLNQIAPANMIIETGLKYNRHSDLAAYTHGQLAAFTHEQLREDETIQ